MKRLPRRVWCGIFLLVVGASGYGLWLLWLGMLIGRPVSMPVSLAVGEVRTPEFRIYKDKYYNIDVEVKKLLPLAVLNCMLGISTGPLDRTNCGKRPVVQANWALWSGGQLVGHGSADDHRSGGWGNDTVDCFIGKFKGQSGKNYVLTVSFIEDGSALAVTDPHLKVEVADGYLDADEMMQNLVILALVGLVEVIGMILLVFSGIRYWRNRHAAPAGP